MGRIKSNRNPWNWNLEKNKKQERSLLTHFNIHIPVTTKSLKVSHKVEFYRLKWVSVDPAFPAKLETFTFPIVHQNQILDWTCCCSQATRLFLPQSFRESVSNQSIMAQAEVSVPSLTSVFFSHATSSYWAEPVSSTIKICALFASCHHFYPDYYTQTCPHFQLVFLLMC